MFLSKRVHIRQRPYRDVGSSENLERGSKALPSDFQEGMQWKSFVPNLPKSGVCGGGGGGQLPLLPPCSAGPLRVIVVGVKRDFVEFF